jgi:RimJ/RimL family protein N-acetyltransferase
MKITYRILQAHDTKAYHDLRLICLQTYPDNFGSDYESEAQKANFKFDIALLKNTKDEFLFGAFDEAKLIGMVGFEIPDKRAKTKHRSTLSHVFLLPEYQGKGIAQTLLFQCIELAFTNKDVEQIELLVVADNPTAIQLYEKLGFIKCAEFKNYFKQGNRYWNQVMMSLNKQDYLQAKLD